MLMATGLVIATVWGWEAGAGQRGFVSIYIAPFGIASTTAGLTLMIALQRKPGSK